MKDDFTNTETTQEHMKGGRLRVMWSVYSPAGTRSVGCRPLGCRCRPTARSAPSRTAGTRWAPPPTRRPVLPTTSPACPASRSHSSASRCPACPGRPPARACPAESHHQHIYSTGLSMAPRLCLLRSAIRGKRFQTTRGEVFL